MKMAFLIKFFAVIIVVLMKYNINLIGASAKLKTAVCEENIFKQKKAIDDID